jgi:hypothetical protein
MGNVTILIPKQTSINNPVATTGMVNQKAMDLSGRPAGSQSTPAGVKISFKLPNDKKEKLFRRWAVEHGAVITTPGGYN